jgi:hypothetical protein
MVMLEKRPTWSDNEIARHCSVVQSFVSGMRPSYHDDKIREVRRGEIEYKMSVGNIGKRRPIEDEYGDGIPKQRCPTCGQVVL